MSLNEPQPAPKPGATDVWPLVIADVLQNMPAVIAADLAADMRERDAAGRQKYGTPLQAENGRDHLVDAYQEALDLCVYLRAAWMTASEPRLWARYLMALRLVVDLKRDLGARS